MNINRSFKISKISAIPRETKKVRFFPKDLQGSKFHIYNFRNVSAGKRAMAL